MNDKNTVHHGMPHPFIEFQFDPDTPEQRQKDIFHKVANSIDHLRGWRSGADHLIENGVYVVVALSFNPMDIAVAVNLLLEHPEVIPISVLWSTKAQQVYSQNKIS